MQMAAILHDVRSFILNNYLLGQDKELENSDSFLEKGVIDSTGVLELVAYLQEAFGITVEDEEITPDNMDSINCVSTYLHRKLNGTDETEATTALVETGGGNA
jgi:acyl carrier protein